MAFLIIIAVVVIGLILKSCSEKKTFEKEINDYKRKYEMEFEKEILENNLKTPMDLYNYGLKYYDGCYKDGVFVKDYQKTVYMWKKAANQGLAEAQYGLGIMYETGNGVRKDKEEAERWYNKAAEQGYRCFKAQIRSNDLLQKQSTQSRENQGHVKNTTENITWNNNNNDYSYINNTTNSDSDNNVWGKNYYDKALAFEYGVGVSADENFALEMYEMAAKAGYQPAKEKVKKLKKESIDGEVSPEKNILNPKTIAVQQQGNVTNNTVNNDPHSHFIKAQNSKLLFDQAVELKRKGQYTAALMLYKQAYNAFPNDPDLQSTMYAMAKIYLLLGDYEKACTLFQDGLTQKLAQHDERTAKFYKKYLESQCYGGMSESDPDFSWFHQLTADYSIFIGLSHYLLENNGAELLSRYRNDFNNHIMSVAGKTAAPPSQGYLRTCYDYGWIRVLAIASESYNRCFDKIDFGHVQKRKQEFLDILKTI